MATTLLDEITLHVPDYKTDQYRTEGPLWATLVLTAQSEQFSC